MNYSIISQFTDPRGHHWYLLKKHETEDQTPGWGFFRSENPSAYQPGSHVNVREVSDWSDAQALLDYIRVGRCSVDEVRSWPLEPNFKVSLGDVFLGAKRSRGNHSTIASRRANRKASKVFGH